MSIKQRVKCMAPKAAVTAYKRRKAARMYQHNMSLAPDEYPTELVRWYKRATGKNLDLNNPKTYDEKIQWLKLYDSTPEKGRLADKYLVREYVAEKIGAKHLVPLLGVWDDPDKIDFEMLPQRFVLKATHGCAWNIIVRDKALLDESWAREQLRKWLAMDYSFCSGLELHYGYCEPRVIAEEFLENDGGDLYDYKFFCFGGKVESVMFLKDRTAGLKMAFFDRGWNKLPYVYSYPRIEEDVPRPAYLDEAIRLAEMLAEGFPHVRVDFYISNSWSGGILFGEMTFTSLSGACKWNPPEQDMAFGELLDLTSLPKWKEMHGS